MHGEFKSVFKGTGLEFDDVRSYQYGDDIRRIDWNTSAKGHGTFIKTFVEEKDQSILFLLDVSASQDIGSKSARKIDVAKEIVGVLSLSAARQGSQIGLIGFSDQKELYIKPGKGSKHAYNIINSTYALEAKSKKTDLNAALVYTQSILKRKSIVIFISDFIDQGFDKHFKSMARKHDLICVHIHDVVESKLPNLGIIPLKDKESGKTMWVNSSFSSFKSRTSELVLNTMSNLSKLSRKNQVNYIEVSTGEDFVPKLISMFRQRNKVWKRG